VCEQLCLETSNYIVESYPETVERTSVMG
jgi:hypothetical protein